MRTEPITHLEIVRRQKIKKMEQFLEVVLQRSSSEEEFVTDAVRGEDPEEFRLVVLQSMRLIDDQHLRWREKRVESLDGRAIE